MSFFSDLFKSRKKEMFKLSYELDMDWREQDEYGLLSMLKEFKLFNRGHTSTRKVKNILRNALPDMSSDIYIFDYTFVTGAGKSRHRHNQTVFFVNAKDLNLPYFMMKPEHFFHKIGQYLGWTKDIDFDTHPEFSDKYILQGGSEEYVRETFHDEILHFFTVEKNWSMEGVGYYLIFYKSGSRIKTKRIHEFYDKGLYLYDMFRNASGGT